MWFVYVINLLVINGTTVTTNNDILPLITNIASNKNADSFCVSIGHNCIALIPHHYCKCNLAKLWSKYGQTKCNMVKII